MRILCWFSCGAASAVAAKATLNRYAREHEVLIVNCDTRPSEDPDNYRFTEDCRRWFGQDILHLRSDKYATVDDVFAGSSYMSGIKGAVCTTELKKKPRLDFAQPDDAHVFGFTADEPKRIREFSARNPDMRLLWVLRDLGITKAHCYAHLRAAGIALPAMYAKGFDNNNCPGCVKASSPWYWQQVRQHYPEVFARRCEQSRRIGCKLVEIRRHRRIFLDELPDRPYRKIKEHLACGPECGLQTTFFDEPSAPLGHQLPPL